MQQCTNCQVNKEKNLRLTGSLGKKEKKEKQFYQKIKI